MTDYDPSHLYGFHDPGGEHLMLDAGKRGWALVTDAVGHDPNWPSGLDFSYLADRGIGVIARLNNGYGSDGTIPLPRYYDDFAQRCANFVSDSRGCHIWVIGNEMNHADERPEGQPITPDLYAQCYKKVRSRIHAQAGTEHQVILGPVAPYNIQTTYPGNLSGDWVQYFVDLVNLVRGNCDGFALHTYTWGSDPALITSEERMAPPYQARHKQFRAYRDFMDAIPQQMRQLPVYITETNQGGAGEAWRNVPNAWVQAAYKEIDDWNRSAAQVPPGGRQIRCVLLFRWGGWDERWNISTKEYVIADFRAALNHDYKWGYRRFFFWFPFVKRSI
jgi:hypothetical protein